MEYYHAEIEGRWRKTAADEQSQAKTSKYSHTDFATAKVDQVAATELFGYALGNSLSVTSKKLQAVVVAHRETISKWFTTLNLHGRSS